MGKFNFTGLYLIIKALYSTTTKDDTKAVIISDKVKNDATIEFKNSSYIKVLASKEGCSRGNRAKLYPRPTENFMPDWCIGRKILDEVVSPFCKERENNDIDGQILYATSNKKKGGWVKQMISEKVRKYDFCMHEPNEKSQYRLMFLFPRELLNNPVLKEGISNATAVFDEWVNVTSEMKHIERICDDMPFEVQKEPYKDKIKTLTSKKHEIEEKMNKNLAPYFWEIHEKISTEYDRFEIKADYGLALQKRNKDWDE